MNWATWNKDKAETKFHFLSSQPSLPLCLCLSFSSFFFSSASLVTLN